MITLREGNQIAERVAAKYQRLCPWISRKDLTQEAWVGMLSARNYDLEKGSFQNYFSKAAANHVLKFVLRFRFPVSSYKFLKLEFVELGNELCSRVLQDDIFLYRETVEMLYKHIQDKGVSKDAARYALSILAGICTPNDAAFALSKNIRQVYRLVSKTRNIAKMENRDGNQKIKTNPKNREKEKQRNQEKEKRQDRHRKLSRAI